LEVLIDEIPNSLPPCKMVDFIEMVPILAMPSKAPYRLNQKELKELKKQLNYLLIGGIFGKTNYLMGHLSCLLIRRTTS
jgi:hypothetical protein